MKQEISDHLIRSFSWVQNNIQAFNPIDPTDGILPLKVKALSELSLVCMVAYWYEQPIWAGELRMLIESVAPLLCSYSLQSAILRQPFLCNVIIPAYVCIEQCGISFPKSRILIQRLIDSGYVFSVEMAPYEKMGRYFYLNLAGYQIEPRSSTSLYQETFLHQMSYFCHFEDKDVYPITHVLFYLSSFGRNNLHTLLGSYIDQVSSLMEMLLGFYVREGNWDIVSECLICSLFLKQPFSPIIQAAWKGLLSAQHLDGYIMGKSYDRQLSEYTQGEGTKADIFKQNYHPTLVAIMAFILYLAMSTGDDRQNTP